MANAYAAAKKMQAFYEPAYFGHQTGYGQAFNSFAGGLPVEMGGFSLRNAGNVAAEEYDGPSLPDELGPYGAAIRSATRAREAYAAPPINDISRYGMGQLENYGMGALDAYAPLVRESDLKWR